VGPNPLGVSLNLHGCMYCDPNPLALRPRSALPKDLLHDRANIIFSENHVLPCFSYTPGENEAGSTLYRQHRHHGVPHDLAIIQLTKTA